MPKKTAHDAEVWTPERLRALRKSYGESRRVFAGRLRVTMWAVQHWEDGVTAIPETQWFRLTCLQMLQPQEEPEGDGVA